MIRTRTVSFVPASVIVNTLIPDCDQQDALSNYMDHWSWGDTLHTLVGNKEFFHSLLQFWQSEMGTDMSNELQDEFWQMVGYESYIDLES